MPAATRVLLGWSVSDLAAKPKLDLADGSKLDRSSRAVTLTAFDEYGRLDVVAGRGVGKELVEEIAPRRVPQVMVRIDNCEIRVNDLLEGRTCEPVCPRGEDAAESRRSRFRFHCCSPQIMPSCFAPGRGGSERRATEPTDRAPTPTHSRGETPPAAGRRAPVASIATPKTASLSASSRDRG